MDHAAAWVGARFGWRFAEADVIERDAFPDAGSALAAAAAEPVAPPNRLRAVHSVVGPDGRRYFLKRFRSVQVKNLCRNLLTLPRAATDAEREAGIASALRAAGYRAPRPVAIGRAGRASLLLLAEMPGEPLAAMIAAGRCPRALADRVAEHCGGLLRAGFALPDLSADHVFVDGDDPTTCVLGVLDLHDGTLGAVLRRTVSQRTVSQRTVRRCLRRFARSVRGLPVARPAALRFAVRLCRAAGAGRRARALLRSLPPFDTHGRYDHGARAARYADGRAPARAAAELELLQRVWPGNPGDSVLDAPCGAGRLRTPLIAAGARWHGADRSHAMLRQARASATAARSGPLCAADALALPFADRAFDGVVVFRFLHHLPPPVARDAIAEACRVADRFVVATFFHPVSAHHVRRWLAGRPGGRAATRFAWTLAALDRWMAAHGFERSAHAAQRPFVRDLWIAAYRRLR